MPFFRRKRVRLSGFDYTQPTTHFITLCTQNRLPLFGQINNVRMNRNAAGQLIHNTWFEIGDRFPMISLDEFITIPNHIHGLFCLNIPSGVDDIPGNVSIPDILQWFKTKTTYDYSQKVHGEVWTPYNKKLWQRSFYDRIVRDSRELQRIRIYIRDNPINWELDEYHSD